MITSTLFDEAARQARAEVIARETVVALRSDIYGPSLTDAQRVTAVVESLIRSAAVADMMADRLPVDDVTLSRIHAASMKLASMSERMRTRAAMKSSLAELAGVMGKRAP